MSDQALITRSIQVESKKHLDINGEDLLNSNCSRQNTSNGDIITREDAIYLSKLTISTLAALIDYKLKSYSEEKIGFLGSHQKLVLEARKPGCNSSEKRSFFVKTMPYDVPLQAAYALEKNAFAKEVEFFRKVEPLMIENYKGDAWAPKCYLAKEDTLVFEDMKLKGFFNADKFLNEDCVMSAAACIARFHASSLLAEERLNGKSLNEMYPKAFEESEFVNTGRKYTWYTTAIDLVISVAKDLGIESSHIFEASKRVFDIAVPSKTKRNVVIHGDLWSSNMLFDKTNHCTLVDFQLLRYAPPGQDLMQLLYFCTSRKFRKEREGKVLEHYYSHLKETLEMNDFKGKVPSFEEILQGVEEQRFPALVSAAINFPTIMIDGKIGAKLMNNPNSYEEYFFRDRKPIVDQIMTLDPEYERRVKDIVREVAETSLKVEDFPRVK